MGTLEDDEDWVGGRLVTGVVDGLDEGLDDEEGVVEVCGTVVMGACSVGEGVEEPEREPPVSLLCCSESNARARLAAQYRKSGQTRAACASHPHDMQRMRTRKRHLVRPSYDFQAVRRRPILDE